MSHKPIPSRDLSTPVNVTNLSSVSLYAKREKIHARSITGFFQNIRVITIWTTLAVYLLLPWVTWEGRQALLFDLPARKFYIFWWTFIPQDFFLLSWLMIIAAFGLFAVTVFAGRVYCGYVCPQTVWTKIFMWIEKAAEGERHVRLRMDQSNFSINKLLRRSIKHAGWFGVAFITAITFVGYFTPARTLTLEFLRFNLGPWELFWISFFTLATYINAGWMREQVCMYMCPYGRFQSVMMDNDTLIISYDENRGEARGSRKKDINYQALGLGDCIDCTLCVQVCPTGIDIRDGLQYECIQCAACVDACDSIMDQMGYARGLVRYTTENLLKKNGHYQLLRLRLVAYAIVISLMLGIFLTVLALRVPLAIEAIRDRNQLYRENNAGFIENTYLLKITNKSQKSERYKLRLDSDVKAIQLLKSVNLTLEAGEILSLPVTLTADPALLKKTNYEIHFKVQALRDAAINTDTESRFLAPPPH